MRLPLLAATIALAGCAAQPGSREPMAQFLAFGDSGYRYEYLEADEGEGVTTPEAYLEHEQTSNGTDLSFIGG